MTNPIKTISRILKDGDNFLVASHYNPDGDAIGSTLAMGHILKHLGKSFFLYNETGMPKHYGWLGLPGPLSTGLPEKEPDWYIALDCGNAYRLGHELEARIDRKRTILIDHHLGNSLFGEVRWVDPLFSSVGEMEALIAKDLGIPLAGDLGEAVYLAIVTDTGYFSYGNTRPQTFLLAAEIIGLGLDQETFNARLKNHWSLNRLKLLSAVLGGAGLHLQGRVGVVSIPAALLEETGTTLEDCEGLVNYVLRVAGVKIAVSLREEGPAATKFSLRSSGGVNVQQIAAEFGGGGHRNAAGGSVNMDIIKAEKAIVRAAGEFLGP